MPDSLNGALALLKELRDTTPITAQRKRIDEFFAVSHDAQSEISDNTINAILSDCISQACLVSPTKKIAEIMRKHLRTTEPVSGRGASCDDPRTIKVSETMALIPPDGVNPRTPSLPPEQPDECPKCKTAFVAGLAAGRPNDYAKLEAELATLQRFKDYVHKRLDEAGIPTHPEGEHSKHGCRIGDRLDIALRSPMREISKQPTKGESMNFGEAQAVIESGGKVARAGWNGKGMHIFTIKDWNFNQIGDAERLPFTAMKTADNKIVAWTVSQTDAYAKDWEIVI